MQRCVPMVRRGLSEDCGSWKIICMRRAERPERRARQIARCRGRRRAARRRSAGAGGPACGRASSCPSRDSPTRPSGSAARRCRGRRRARSRSAAPAERAASASGRAAPRAGRAAGPAVRRRLSGRRVIGAIVGARLRQQLVGERPRHRRQRLGRPVEARRRREQRARIGVARAAPAPRRSAPCSSTRPAWRTVTVWQSLATSAEVVGDEQHRRAVAVLEVVDQPEDLALHGDVERRRRLVGDDQPRLRRRRPWRSGCAGACRRKSRADRGRSTRAGLADGDLGQELDGALARRARGRGRAAARSTAPICSPTRLTGLSEVIGSCGISAIRVPRSAPAVALGDRREIATLEAELAARDTGVGAAAGRRSRGRSSTCRRRIRRPAHAPRRAPIVRPTPRRSGTVACARRSATWRSRTRRTAEDASLIAAAPGRARRGARRRAG